MAREGSRDSIRMERAFSQWERDSAVVEQAAHQAETLHVT